MATNTAREHKHNSLQESSSATDSEEDSVELQNCSCKSTCQRRGKYPCKSAGVFCGRSCTCGSRRKPCKNKPSGADEVRPAVTEAGLERNRAPTHPDQMQEFVSPPQDLQKLVTAAYCNEGGLEFARALLCDPPQDFPRDPGGNDSLPWCICHKCLAMDTSEENVCYCKTPCVTEMGWFDSVVLNRDVLSLAIEARSDIYADTPVYTPASYRKAVYRQYILWQHGYMGRNNRRVIPFCVVWCIRRKYPAPDGRYLGFREYREDDLI